MSGLKSNPEWLERRKKLIAKGGQMGGTRVSDMKRYKPQTEKCTTCECIVCDKPITLEQKKEGKIIQLTNDNWIHEDCV